MSNTKVAVTAETITARQIKALRDDALAAGDYMMVDVCDRALTPDSDTTDQDGNEAALSDWTQGEARAECASAISDAQAQA